MRVIAFARGFVIYQTMSGLVEMTNGKGLFGGDSAYDLICLVKDKEIRKLLVASWEADGRQMDKADKNAKEVGFHG